MSFDLISGLHMQIQTWHPPLRLCIHAKYYVKSGLTNVLKNANKTTNKHLFFNSDCQIIVELAFSCKMTHAVVSKFCLHCSHNTCIYDVWSF